jgi:polyhydroxyalkanoate synthesis regulator phasin
VEYKAIRGQGVYMKVVTIKTDSPSKIRRKIRALKSDIEEHEYHIDESEMDIQYLEEEIAKLKLKLKRLKNKL